MDTLTSLLIIKAVLISGTALWAAIAVINNVLDPKTNIGLVGAMMKMTLIKQDQETLAGKGLVWRAIDNNISPILSVILAIALQILTVGFLWYAGILLVGNMVTGEFNAQIFDTAIAWANLGFGAMLVMGFFFLSGGLWFAYWIKMPQVQQVHMTVVIISLLSIAVVNI